MSSRGERAEEKLARRRLEPHLGQLEPTDVPGTSGLPDYKTAGDEVDGYVEVTSRPDKRRRTQRAAIRRHPNLDVSTPGVGSLYLYPNTDIRNLCRAPKLNEVLEAAKRVPGLMTVNNCPREIADLMDALGIEGAVYKDASGATGTVSLSGGTTGARGVQGRGVDKLLDEAFQQLGVIAHVKKLARAGGRSRHLYLEVDSSSQSGLAIAIGLDVSTANGAAPYRLPEFVPPQDLTDLWVWPDSPGPGLHFQRGRGWRVVPDAPWE